MSRRWALAITCSITGVFGFVAGAIVGLGGGGAAPHCGSLAGCLTDPSSLLSAFHLASAGLLLALSVAVLLLAYLARSIHPLLPWLGLGALLLLLGMASLGALLATGTLPDSDGPVQYGVLAVYLATNATMAVLAVRSSSGVPSQDRGRAGASP